MFPFAKSAKGIMREGSPGSSPATAVRLIKVHLSEHMGKLRDGLLGLVSMPCV